VAPAAPRRRGLFGGKKELEEELARLTAVIEQMGIPERDALRAEVVRLNAELPPLRSEEQTLLASLTPMRAEAAQLATERAAAEAMRADVTQLTGQRDALNTQIAASQHMVQELPQLQAQYDELRKGIIETDEMAILQEVGIYNYRHPLDDSPAYKAKLTGIQARIKDAVKAGSAVHGSTTWTVNGSTREGAKMVREFSKLMLRAYNNEADALVHSMKPYALESCLARLDKARETISKLGGTMNIRITDPYHRLHVEELELTADYLAKVAEEKERDREVRARLREEEIAKREFEREQERLRKEQAQYEATIATLRERGDHEAAAEAEAKLTEINDALDGVTRRAANIRAGHVYVISNMGAFGPEMVKIGMTRRLDPMDRVRELGDASVPFHYDVHAMVFSEDAVGLETQLHHALEAHRVNLINLRREFFHTHPSTVRDLMMEAGAALVTWVENPEASEYRQSENARRHLQEASASAAP
jgi:seryl-tRNA synthetase